jgi:predicted enzyme related to lactoylglutathione lyase
VPTADCPVRQNAGVQLTAANPVLAVHDLERSSAWYERALGCESAEIDGGGWVFCRQGEVTFMLGLCPDVVPAADIGDHSYVAYLRVDDVDAFHRRALDAGGEILKPPTDEPWGMREMALRSPDGHRFMLGAPTPSS